MRGETAFIYTGGVVRDLIPAKSLQQHLLVLLYSCESLDMGLLFSNMHSLLDTTTKRTKRN